MKTKKTLRIVLFFFTLLEGGWAFSQAPNQPGAGNCLSFNTTTQTVNVGQVNNIGNSSSSIFSTEQWVMFNNVNATQFVISRYYGGPSSGIFGWYINMLTTGQIELHFNNSQIGNTSTIYTGIVANRWYHIATTYNGTTGSLYIDGNLVGTCGNPGGGTNGNYVAIGSLSNTYCYNCGGSLYTINGQIDEVRIWNTALTQTQIRDNMCKKLVGNELGLVGYWRFDETTGNIAFDSQTNVAPNDGTGF